MLLRQVAFECISFPKSTTVSQVSTLSYTVLLLDTMPKSQQRGTLCCCSKSLESEWTEQPKETKHRFQAYVPARTWQNSNKSIPEDDWSSDFVCYESTAFSNIENCSDAFLLLFFENALVIAAEWDDVPYRMSNLSSVVLLQLVTHFQIQLNMVLKKISYQTSVMKKW